MASYETAYGIVHKHEGGYANQPGDKGGETYMGIARVYHPKWPGWQLIDAYKAANGPIKRFTFLPGAGLTTLVLNFYRGTWRTMRGDELHSQPVANLLYDFFTGSGRAIEVAQRVLVERFGRTLTIDNEMGPATVAAINAVPAEAYHNALLDARIAYLRKVAERPGQAQFLPDWLARCRSFVYIEKKTA